MPDRSCEIVHLVATVHSASRTNYVHGPLAWRGNSPEHSIGGIFRSGDCEKNFVLRVITMRQAKKICFEILFHSFHVANKGYGRRIAARSRAQAPALDFVTVNPLPQALAP